MLSGIIYVVILVGGAVATKEQEVFTYGNFELKKTDQREWSGDKEGVSATIKFLKHAIELTKKPKDGSWEQKILFDPEGELQSMEITPKFFKEPLTVNIAEENRLGKELASALKTLGKFGINYKNLECTITDSGNSIAFKPPGIAGEDKDKICIRQGGEIRTYRKYNIDDLSLHSIYFATHFKTDVDVLDIPQETAWMKEFLSHLEVQHEAGRMKLLHHFRIFK